MNPQDIIIEPVEGTRWVIARHPDSPYVVPAPDLPPYASPALKEGWRDRLAAIVNQRCYRCDAVADIPAAVKTAAPNSTFTSMHEVPHTPDCPCRAEALQALHRECSPFGTIEPADFSDESIDKLCAQLQRIESEIRAAAASTEPSDPEGGTDALP